MLKLIGCGMGWVMGLALAIGCGTDNDDTVTPGSGGNTSSGGSAAGGEASGGVSGSSAGGSSAGGSASGGSSAGGTASGGTTNGGSGGASANGGTASGGTSSGGTSGAATLDDIEQSCEEDCAARYELDCAAAPDQSVCEQDCVEAANQLDEACFGAYDALVRCKVDGGYECAGEEPVAVDACAASMLDVGDCIADESEDEDLCAGWCWAAARLGCGEGCAADCEAKRADADCGKEYSDVLDCALRFGDAACEGATLVANANCDANLRQYQACLAGAQ